MRPSHLLLVAVLACDPCGPPPLDASPEACAALQEAGVLPETVAAAEARRASGETWSDAEIRRLYVCRARRIGVEDADREAAGATAEARARAAYETRHTARMVARSLMADPSEVAALQARDREKYGDPDGPTFDWLVEQARAKGLEGDALYESIVESAQRTNEATNRRFGL